MDAIQTTSWGLIYCTAWSLLSRTTPNVAGFSSSQYVLHLKYSLLAGRPEYRMPLWCSPIAAYCESFVSSQETNFSVSCSPRLRCYLCSSQKHGWRKVKDLESMQTLIWGFSMSKKVLRNPNMLVQYQEMWLVNWNGEFWCKLKVKHTRYCDNRILQIP